MTKQITEIRNIEQALLKQAENILNFFNISFFESGGRLSFCCPIHDSNNQTSMCVYLDSGRVKCWTRHCEDNCNGFYQLVSFLLHKKYKEKFSQKRIEDFAKYIEKNSFGRAKRTRTPRAVKDLIPTISRNHVRVNLQIPSEYYINRGYSPEILNKYDIGFSFKRGDELYLRTVVPVYNEDYKLIGKLGRTHFDKCLICDTYHGKNKLCPTNNQERGMYPKWKNSQGFCTGHHFYNLWFAAEHIRKSKKVILVEGCGDVLRLEESGVHIGLGLFGLELTSRKIDILRSLDITDVYLALDGDEAGQNQIQKIKAKIEKIFNTYIVNLPLKDLGETPISEVQQIFKGIV